MSYNFLQYRMITKTVSCMQFIPDPLIAFLIKCLLEIVVVVQVLRPIISNRIQAYRWDALSGGLSKGSQPVFTRVSEKTTENSERLGRQARPGFEPGTSRLPVLSVKNSATGGANLIGNRKSKTLTTFISVILDHGGDELL